MITTHKTFSTNLTSKSFFT